VKSETYTLGASAPVGAAGVVKAAYNHYQYQPVGVATKLKADQLSLGYEHNLSKRTAVYGTYAFLKNKDYDAAVGGMSLEPAALLSDSGKQQGLQVGVRHTF
jgi:predicted porin